MGYATRRLTRPEIMCFRGSAGSTYIACSLKADQRVIEPGAADLRNGS